MTFLTPSIDTATRATASAAGTALKARTARVFGALAGRIEQGAQARARRKAARMSAAELSNLPESVRMELGVNLPDAGRPSPFVQGLVGPSAYWAPGRARARHGNAKS